MVGDSHPADGAAMTAGLEVYLLPQVPRGIAARAGSSSGHPVDPSPTRSCRG